ncbi:hypothetical protein GCK72_010237 [Caenorhabditis remanei]|uniref:Uncharacterized protein n=1 Tax=Caenorhabditis remanei TaxID=31234 RepID=A0A6A5H447_CAERE|nr:hypothetical protein GCK72_010237 [Caenorhabditis remanei]KAF1761977.1 hypothetical protein GCK72_010237 [Caenorhabditis remanei]
MKFFFIWECPIAASTSEDSLNVVLRLHVTTNRVVVRDLLVTNEAMLVISMEVETVTIERGGMTKRFTAMATKELSFEIWTFQFGFRAVWHPLMGSRERVLQIIGCEYRYRE